MPPSLQCLIHYIPAPFAGLGNFSPQNHQKKTSQTHHKPDQIQVPPLIKKLHVFFHLKTHRRCADRTLRFANQFQQPRHRCPLSPCPWGMAEGRGTISSTNSWGTSQYLPPKKHLSIGNKTNSSEQTWCISFAQMADAFNPSKVANLLDQPIATWLGCNALYFSS